MPEKTTLEIEGMSCAACANAIESALKKTQGVASARVNLAAEKACVEYDPGAITRDGLVEVIRNTGYDVKQSKERAVLRIGGMTCAACAAAVENALKKADGVFFASVNIATEKATVEFDPTKVSRETLSRVVSESGYEMLGVEGDEESVSGEEDDDVRKMREARNRMLGAWAFTIPIMLWMIPEMFFGIMWPNHMVMNAGMILLAIPPLAIFGRKTFVSAFKAVSHGSANMDVLIAMGTGAAFLTGPAMFFLPVANYAGVSAMIMAFHLTGRYIEATAKGRASQAIKKLLELGAKTARVIRGDQEVEVPIEQVVPGDILAIRPGEKVPTDGEVIEGSTTIDESMATGESMPVKKQPGDQVIGATINQSGFIKVRATKVGKDTFLAQVIKLVEEAQGTKVPIQEFADRVTGVFVPVVVGIALVTLVVWLVFPEFMVGILLKAASTIPWIDPELGPVTLALSATIAVLVIACPCALGLATPTALLVGSGIGAENGVLIRRGEAIQAMKDVKVVVFDKTGTITKGKPDVTDVVLAKSAPEGSMSEDDLLALAASVESRSEHPLAMAVVGGAQKRGLTVEPPEDFQSITGKGVSARVSGKRVLVGSRRLMQDEGIDASAIEDDLRRVEEEAKTGMIVAVDGTVYGLIAVADPLKEDSKVAIAELKAMGLDTAIVTGDNRRTANAIAKKVGITHVVAEVLPDGKVQSVTELQNKFGTIAMVGDGINDAPALAQADVGIAIGTGTDIAIESSDITLVRGDLSGVVTAVKLSRATFRKIRQNLFWAFFYNVIAIPVAILGFLHPVMAEIAMATSSITVVTNANLLRRVKVTPH
ncbi:MAG TPA: copper-translocating P-type ATPase [Firmicutes bacterium]|nr:copper-translocating P-type ATPase [Candidatus Fermentithermobacillaceae bacterium]